MDCEFFALRTNIELHDLVSQDPESISPESVKDRSELTYSGVKTIDLMAFSETIRDDGVCGAVAEPSGVFVEAI